MWVFFSDHHFTNIKAVFLFWIIKLPSKTPCFWTSQTVNSSHMPKSGHKSNNHGAFRRKPAGIYATDGLTLDRQGLSVAADRVIEMALITLQHRPGDVVDPLDAALFAPVQEPDQRSAFVLDALARVVPGFQVLDVGVDVSLQ